MSMRNYQCGHFNWIQSIQTHAWGIQSISLTAFFSHLISHWSTVIDSTLCTDITVITYTNSCWQPLLHGVETGSSSAGAFGGSLWASQVGRCGWGAVSWGPAWRTEAGSFFVLHIEKALGRDRALSSRPLQPLSPNYTQEVLLQGLADRAAGENKEFLKMRERRCPYQWHKNKGHFSNSSYIHPRTDRGVKRADVRKQKSYRQASCDHSWRICISHPQVYLVDASTAPPMASSASCSFPVNRQKITDDIGVCAQHLGFHNTQNIMKFLSEVIFRNITSERNLKMTGVNKLWFMKLRSWERG